MPERHAGVTSSRGGVTIVATTVNAVHERRAVLVLGRRRDAGDIIVVTGNGLVPGGKELEEDRCSAWLYVDREISRVGEKDTREEKQEEEENEENDDEADCRVRNVDCERRTERPRGFSSYGRG